MVAGSVGDGVPRAAPAMSIMKLLSLACSAADSPSSVMGYRERLQEGAPRLPDHPILFLDDALYGLLRRERGAGARIIAGGVIDRVADHLADFEREIVARAIKGVLEIADRAHAAAIDLDLLPRRRRLVNSELSIRVLPLSGK